MSFTSGVLRRSGAGTGAHAGTRAPTSRPSRGDLTRAPRAVDTTREAARPADLVGSALRVLDGPAPPSLRAVTRLALPVETAVPAIESARGLGPPGRRLVSLRWLGAVALAGLFGMGLLGFALFVAMDGQLELAEAPRAAYTGASSSDPLPRGDALVSRATVVGAKRLFRAPYGHLANGRETMASAPFLRLSTRLLPSSVGLEADVPPLRQADLIREAGVSAGDAALAQAPADPAEEDLGDVSVAVTEMPDDPGEEGPVLPEDVAARQAKATADAARTLQPLASFSSQSTLGVSILAGTQAPAELDSPFASMDVRIVPENITEIARRPDGNAGRRAVAVDVAPGETLADPLRQAGASEDDAARFGSALGGSSGRHPSSVVAEFEAVDGGRRLTRATLKEEERTVAKVALADSGAVVPVITQDPAYGVGPGILGRLAGSASGNEGGGGERPDAMSMHQSLYQTALLNDIPRETIEEVLRLFAFDVDFERAVGPDDRIDLLAREDAEGHGRPVLVYAALTLDRERIAYWRTPAENGGTVFVDSEGRSNRRMLVSKPIVEARLTSGFGSRYHPVLHYTRPHNGIDWANKVGTPIFAAGDGEVIEAGWHSGYGRHVEIRHGDGFVTTYSHMSAIAKGIEPGAPVRLGQTIGALGQTGLATGPHLHFEVKLNDTFVNPLTVRVPRANRLGGADAERFNHERLQIDRVLACSEHGSCQGPIETPPAH
jgi:murein DD-endopeptidase MepM/ murein hydrolase activator NlpD